MFMKTMFVLPVSLLCVACASVIPGGDSVEVATSAAGQPLAGANCSVTTNAGRWTVVTPGKVQIGAPNGDLRVLCSRAGYRSSELVFRPSSSTNSSIGIGLGGGGGRLGVGVGLGFPIQLGGGNYPSSVNVDMTPQ
jgi:hypothetical protein